MEELSWRQIGEAVQFAVCVAPRAGRNAIAGLHGDALKIRLTAPPVEGAANRALVAFLAEQLGVRPYQVTIVSGESGRNKVVAVTGLAAGELHQRLLAKVEKNRSKLKKG
ncbi:MAG: DUF167 domain-containing protein [Chloroflexota bacterium]